MTNLGLMPFVCSWATSWVRVTCVCIHRFGLYEGDETGFDGKNVCPRYPTMSNMLYTQESHWGPERALLMATCRLPRLPTSQRSLQHAEVLQHPLWLRRACRHASFWGLPLGLDENSQKKLNRTIRCERIATICNICWSGNPIICFCTVYTWSFIRQSFPSNFIQAEHSARLY